MSKSSELAYHCAARHHECAAYQYQEAAKYEKAGEYEKAAHHAYLAHGHNQHAVHWDAEAAKLHADHFSHVDHMNRPPSPAPVQETMKGSAA
jgi:hypothetical protein